MARESRLAVVAAAVALVIAACGDGRPAAQHGPGLDTRCTACHGGTDNQTAAPPRDVGQHTSTSSPGVGAHTAHVQAGALAGASTCGDCHPDPRLGGSAHLNGKVDLLFGALATAGGTLSPQFQSQTCNAVYCHGAFPGGNAANAPTWTQVDRTQAACGTCHGDPAARAPALPRSGHPALASDATNATCAVCHAETVDAGGIVKPGSGTHVNGMVDLDPAAKHPAGWSDKGSASFHGVAASQGASACLRCHAAREPAVVAAVTCASCHDALSGDRDWTTTCNTCHGSATNAAPPRDLKGNTVTTARGVGAHQAHVTAARGLAAPLDCTFCHLKPASVLAAGHVDGLVTVIGYTGADPAWIAVGKDPGWSAPYGGCTTSYCHGAFPGGNAGNAPLWTRVDGTQVACGTCHGDPAARAPALPRSGHPALASDATNATCAVCHAETVDAGGIVKPGSGTHVNGLVDVDPAAKHPAGWTENGSASFHGVAAIQDASACLRCHAAREPAVVAAVTCASCHDALSGGGDWTTTCNTCHGSPANAAPPRDVKGNTVTTARGVGAHQAHVTAARGLAAPLDCTFCHRKPASVLAAGHLDGLVTVTGYTGADPTWIAVGKDPGWSAPTGGCTTSYCHGAFPGGNAGNVPLWTRVDGTQAACGTCHGLPPLPPHPAVPAGAGVCDACHPSTVDPAGQIIPASAGGKHLDGVVQGFPGHPPGWMDTTSPTFHAYSANLRISTCALCHGPALDGVGGITTVACSSCHGVSWKTSCTMCHGGTNDASGAPPRATWGNGSDPVRTGAHGRHLAAGPLAGAFGCDACHAKPADALTPGHVDGSVSVTRYTGTDPALAAAVQDPGWSRASATCTTSYCHGAGMPGGTFTAPKWTVLDGSQMACGSCHSLPPHDGPSIGGNGAHDFHVRLHGLLCVNCHLATVDVNGAILGGGKHVNGTRDVVFRDGTVILGWDCTGCHSRIVP